MDVLYVVGTGSRYDDVELRYSLRSIAKNGIGLGNVIIVGHCPKWVNLQHVYWIPYSEPADGVPAKNVFHKIDFAMAQRTAIVPDQFLLSSDDHFFVRPTDFNHYPIHYKSPHVPTSSDIGTGRVGDVRYTTSLVDTIRVMQWYGLDCKFYEGHTNKLYDRNIWNWLRDQGVWNFVDRYEYGISTAIPMAAAYMKFHPDYPCIHRKDIKIGSFCSRDDLLKQIGESGCFSIRDAAIRSGVIDYLQELFPDKSKYER